jgi:hypothetical protein
MNPVEYYKRTKGNVGAGVMRALMNVKPFHVAQEPEKPAIIRGKCGVCKKDVTDKQPRKSDGETYFHAECYNNKETADRERKGERGRRV